MNTASRSTGFWRRLGLAQSETPRIVSSSRQSSIHHCAVFFALILTKNLASVSDYHIPVSVERFFGSKQYLLSSSFQQALICITEMIYQSGLAKCARIGCATNMNRYQNGFQSLLTTSELSLVALHSEANDQQTKPSTSDLGGIIKLLIVGFGIGSFLTACSVHLTRKYPAALKPVWILSTLLPHLGSKFLLDNEDRNLVHCTAFCFELVFVWTLLKMPAELAVYCTVMGCEQYLLLICDAMPESY